MVNSKNPTVVDLMWEYIPSIIAISDSGKGMRNSITSFLPRSQPGNNLWLIIQWNMPEFVQEAGTKRVRSEHFENNLLHCDFSKSSLNL